MMDGNDYGRVYVRWFMRDVAEGRALGDMTTLGDYTVSEKLIKMRYKEGV